MDYINKDYYTELNRESRRYMNILPDAASSFTEALRNNNIMFSAAVSRYKATVTVSVSDYEQARKIYADLMSKQPQMKNITIGNTEYKSIQKRTYINTNEQSAKEISKMLAGNTDIRFSGIIRADGSATITAEGEKNAANIRRMIDNIENADLYETLAQTGFTRSADSRNGFIVIENQNGEKASFENADALRASISDPAYEEFFRTDNFGVTNKEIAIPDEEHFILRQDLNAVDHVYYNPDGNDGEGQFIQTAYYADDIERAYNAFLSADAKAFMDTLNESGVSSTVIDSDVPEYMEYANAYIEFEESENAIRFTGTPSEEIIERLVNNFPEISELRQKQMSDELVEMTNLISAQEAKVIRLIEEKKYAEAAVVTAELAELGNRAEQLKKKIQQSDITEKDVQALRSVRPARKSVQNMLENEVAQTPKFEKLLGDEMGEKSAYEMRSSNNEWRNDETKTVNVVDVQKRDIPENLPEIRKNNSIPRGTFVNKDTGIEINFSRRSIEEVIAKAIPDNKRDIPVEARISALYQMQELIENAICFDSRISEPSKSKKSDNTLFIHRMYGVMSYDHELYFANLAVEESYSTDRDNNFRGTNNRLYSFRDIKITPVKLLGGQAHSSPQIADTDTSSGVKVSIPQLYQLVKENDTLFFENPEAAGRTAREAEIQAKNDYLNAVEELDNYQRSTDTSDLEKTGVSESEIVSEESVNPVTLAFHGDDESLEEIRYMALSLGAACTRTETDLIVHTNDNHKEELFSLAHERDVTAEIKFSFINLINWNKFDENSYNKLVSDVKNHISGSDYALDFVSDGNKKYTLELNIRELGEEWAVDIDIYDAEAEEYIHCGGYYENDLPSYVKFIAYAEKETLKALVHNLGLPFRDVSSIPDYEPMEEFDPYAFDGTMSIEDYNLMHKLMREDKEQREQAFMNADIAAIMAKSVLAWDEIGYIGYLFFEEGYIDKFKPHDASIYGNGLHEPELHDLAGRMQSGEDIRKELAVALIGKQQNFVSQNENEFTVEYGEDFVTAHFGNAEKKISYEELGDAFISLARNEYEDINKESIMENVIEDENGKSAHYVDDVGYKDITDLFLNLNRREQEKADVPVEHLEDTVDLSLVEQLKKRVNAEFEAYISEMDSRSSEEMIAAEYRVTTCKQINEYITNEDPDLTEAQLSALLSMDNVLDEIYLEWVKNDYAEGYDDVPSVMQDRADRILLSQQRESDPLEKAKKFISGYVGDVYGESAYFDNMKNITLDHFTVGRANKHTYNSEADLEAFTIRHRLDGTTVKTDTFDSLEQMNNQALSQLDYTNNTAMAERLCEDFERDLRTAQEENPTADKIAEALNLAENNLTFSVVSIDDEEDFVIGGYADEDSIIETNEYMSFIDIHDTDSVTVRVDFYSVGNSELESEDMSEEQVNYVREHLDEVLKIATALDVRSFDIETEYEEIEEEAAPLEKAIEYIKDFLEVEYGEAETDNAFKDLENVPLGYTSLGDDADHDFSVTANLIDFSISYTLDGVEIATEKYDSLEKMTEDMLSCLDFDDMVTVGNEALEKAESEKFHLVIPEIDVDIDMREIDNIAIQTPNDVLVFYYSTNNNTIERAWQSDDNSDTTVDIDEAASDIRNAVGNGFAVEIYETAEKGKMVGDNSIAAAEKRKLFDTLNYDFNKSFKRFIESMEFTVVKVGDMYSLRDQTNFGDIHSDKFNNAMAMTDRVERYINDYYVRDITEQLDGIISGDLDSVDGIIEAINAHSDDDRVIKFFNDNIFDMQILDLIANHTEDVNLSIAFENAENLLPENLTAIDDDTAIIMWEQGITVYHSSAEIPPMEENRENKHSIFENLSDDFYADKEDVKAFRIADDIASEIWDMNRVFSNVPNEVGQPYYLSLEFGGYDEWENYNKGLNEYENTLKALYTGNYAAVEDYLENIRRSDDVSKEMQEQAAALLDAVKSFKNLSGIEDRAKKENEPTYKIYQLKKGEEYHNLRFTRWDDMPRFNLSFDKKNYDEVYGGSIADVTKFPFKEGILEDIFKKFNTELPENFTGHSLSVSDVVVLEDKEGSSAHFVDTVGMVNVTDLFFGLDKEIIDLSSLTELEITEEYDRRGDEPDNSRHIRNTILFTDLDKTDAISRFKEFTYDYDVMPDSDEGYTTVTSQDMLDEINEYFELTRKDSSISISITDNEGNTKRLNGLLFEFTIGEQNVPLEHLDENGHSLDYASVHKENSAEEKSQSEYVPKIGDKFRDRMGSVWEITSLTGALPWYTDECAVTNDRGGYFVTKNETYANLLDPKIYERIGTDPQLSQSKKSVEQQIIEEKKPAEAEIGQVQSSYANLEITQADVDILRTLPPRKSILNFTDEEKEITAKWAERFQTDIAEKSPYFRADNGDWRENEQTRVPIIEIEKRDSSYSEIKADVKERVIERGTFTNNDTNWDIQISRKGLEDTIRYAFKHNDNMSYDMMYSIKQLVTNAVLLDTQICERNKDNKAQNTAFMHNMYSICKIDDELCIAKLRVEEFGDSKGDTLKRLYNLQDIKIEPLRVIGLAENQLRPAALNGTDISIADLFKVVKSFDKDFYINSPDYALTHDKSAEKEHLKSEYVPKIGDLIDINDELLSISEIDGSIITFMETETLFGRTRRMDLSEFLSADFTVVEEAERETAEAELFSDVLVEDVPPEHLEEAHGNENVPPEHLEKTPEKENAPVEHHTSNTDNFVITDENFGVKTPKARFAANAAAIRTLNAIEAEHRVATTEEQAILSGYTGWGAIPNAFDPDNKDWSNEYAELKKLLTDEEYMDARRSTMNAHFTSPVIINAIYEGLANLGFEQGKILEPAMGIGNFFGAMPEAMRGSELHGVELDSLTGRIAKQLYPGADIQIKGFEKTNFENDSFDVIVGNVPFGDYKVDDKDYNKHKFYIHDYFIAKSIDKVRPGGVVAVVTSKGTMDKDNPEMRKYIAQRAELLGAIRLPNDAFKKNAGTEVTSDILFFQKRERAIEINPDEIEWIGKSETPEGFRVNGYFANHPEMVLGTITEANQKYGPTENTQVIPIEGADLKQQLSEAVKNIQGTYTPRARTAEKKKEAEDIVPAPANSRAFSYYAVNGSVYFRGDSETMTNANLKGETLKRALAMIELRDTVRELLDMQLDNADHSYDADIADCRAVLNEKYNAFAEKFGHFDDKKNIRAFKGDDGYNFLTALESRNKETGEYEKADIFFHDTVKPNNVVTHVETAEEALILSVAEKARVDFDYMTELTGMSKETLISELEGQIYRLPQEEEKYVTSDEYLTGNIRTKLRQLEYAPDDMDVSKHREALEAAMPKRVEAKDISVKLGAHWVAPEYVTQFIKQKFHPGWTSKVEAQYSKVTGRWKIEGASQSDKGSYSATHDYGTKRKNAYAILEGLLNHEDMTIKDPKLDEYGKPIRDPRNNIVKVTNHEETKAVQLMVKKIESEWSDWIFKDPDRREALVDKYNEVFNSIRHREYDGSHLNFVGMNSDITLKEHQKNAVARALYGGNTLLAHAVGAGKTFEMITIAMEGKRLGLHNKCLFAVPNSLTEQMGRDFRKLYPNANILVATKKDFEPKNRKMLFAKIATGEWDAVIVGHSQFDRMGLSAERMNRYLKAEIESLRSELEEAKETDGAKSFSVKEIEKTIARYEKRLTDEQSKVSKDDYIDFEQMGFDKIFVDECHMYKNLGTATKMSNVAGIGTTGSGKAAELLMKTKYLDELTGGKGLVFASGTPVSNSMTELYTMMRYLQTSLLRECGISHFDEWAADFGTVKTDYELKPESDGKYQLKTRFAQFNNLPELMGMFKEAADIRTADTLDLEKPVAHVHEVVAQPSKIQKRLIKSLSKRASKIREGVVDPKDDNMLCITNDGRKIGLDQRLMQPGCEDDPNSKVNMCVNNVYDIYQKNTDKKSTQMIFCDMSTPKQANRQDRFEIYRPTRESGFECIRRKVGLGKPGNKSCLGTFDDLKKYVDKTTNDIDDKLQDGDIAVFRVPSEDGKSIESRAALYMGGKFSEANSEELLEQFFMSPVEDMPPKTFNVYDDIRDKLIAKGVPEKEIAFIHDYDTAEKKQELFNQMNSGDVRILLGSTQKCGAGMNAQERMIALHHLDAPLRPSDMEQRNGRIERQGNSNPEVDIFRYVTDKSFDAYLYQILENKQRFISQVMTSKTPERVCSDVDEQALDYAEVKALCAGNPLIKREMELQAQIKDLKSEKSRFNENLYELQDNIRVKYPAEIKNNDLVIKHYTADLKTAESAPKFVDNEGKESYPLKMGEKVYNTRKQAGTALKEALLKNISAFMTGKEVALGEYRGLKLSVMYNDLKQIPQACLQGEKRHYCDLNIETDTGNMIRLDNAIGNLAKTIEDLSAKNGIKKRDLEQMKIDVEKPFAKEQELRDLEAELEDVHTQLTQFELTDDSAQKDIFERFVDCFTEVMTGDKKYVNYESKWASLMPFHVEMQGSILTVAQTYEQNGDLMYDPRIDFKVDYENRKVIPISYENSGLGVYQEYNIDDGKPETMKDINSVLTFVDDWMDNIEEQGCKPVEKEENKERDESYLTI